MKKILLLSCVLTAAVACQKSVVDNSPDSSGLSDRNRSNAIELKRTTKYGCAIGGNFTSDQRGNQALKLNVRYVRSAISMDLYNGKSYELDCYASKGIKVLLNVCYNTITGYENPKPFATDMADYRQKLTNLFNTYQPEVVVVENEEINKHFHTGPLSDYIKMLSVALDVAHAKGLKVTNGGIYGGPLFVLTYRYLASINQSRADSFANNCMWSSQVKAAQHPGINPYLESNVSRIDTLLNYYSNLDYVNVHFYEPVNPNLTTTQKAAQSTATPLVFADVKEYLTARTGKPVITNETCARNNSVPSLVTSMLQTYDQASTPYAIWWSNEGIAGGVPLYNLNTGVLQPNGVAFSTYNSTY